MSMAGHVIDVLGVEARQFVELRHNSMQLLAGVRVMASRRRGSWHVEPSWSAVQGNTRQREANPGWTSIRLHCETYTGTLSTLKASQLTAIIFVANH